MLASNAQSTRLGRSLAVPPGLLAMRMRARYTACFVAKSSKKHPVVGTSQPSNVVQPPSSYVTTPFGGGRISDVWEGDTIDRSNPICVSSAPITRPASHS